MPAAGVPHSLAVTRAERREVPCAERGTVGCEFFTARPVELFGVQCAVFAHGIFQ